VRCRRPHVVITNGLGSIHRLARGQTVVGLPRTAFDRVPDTIALAALYRANVCFFFCCCFFCGMVD